MIAAGIPEDQIKPPSALLTPGADNNANMIVRENNGKLMAYVWSAGAGEWSVLGEVMERPEDTMNVPKKVCSVPQQVFACAHPKVPLRRTRHALLRLPICARGRCL